MLLNFGQAIEALNQGCCIARIGWNVTNMFICKQIPSDININIIPKMQSLPNSAKELLLDSDKDIHYVNQMIIVNLNTRNIDSWVASSSDTFAKDWYVLKN